MIARHVRVQRSLLLLSLGLLCLLCAQAQVAAESAYEQIRGTISTLADSDYAKPLILSVTKHGRPILGVVITDPAVPIKGKTRIVIVAGQHGNEPSPAFSAAELALRWASEDSFADLRRNAVVLIIPTANPDGLANSTRFVSSGADPNRDWDRLSLPETRTIAKVIDRWKPHLVLDEHEWNLTDGYRFDCVELSSNAPNQSLVSLARRIRAESMPAEFSPVDSQPWRDPSLFHRHFLAEGYLTYLIETSPSESIAAKQRLYMQLTVALSRQAVANREAIDACSASAEPCKLPELIAAWRPEPQPVLPRKKSFGAEAAVAMAAIYCLLLLCGQVKRSSASWFSESKTVSPRAACVPTTPYGMLPEITFRSRASRQMRRGR